MLGFAENEARTQCRAHSIHTALSVGPSTTDKVANWCGSHMQIDRRSRRENAFCLGFPFLCLVAITLMIWR